MDLERTEVALRIVHEAVNRRIITPLPHAPGTPLVDQLRLYARGARKDASWHLRRLRFDFSAPQRLKRVFKRIKKEAKYLEKHRKAIIKEYEFHFFCSQEWIPKTYSSGDKE